MSTEETSPAMYDIDRVLSEIGLGPQSYNPKTESIDESMRRLQSPASVASDSSANVAPPKSEDRSSALSMELRLAELQRQNLEFQRKMIRSQNTGRVANVLKWPVIAGSAVAVAAVVMNYLFPGGDHSSPPSHKLPAPTTAFSKLNAADTLVFASGEVSEVANTTVRATICTPLDLYCQDIHAGGDVSTTVQSPVQYSVDGGLISYGVIKGPNKQPIAIARINDNDIAQDLVNPVVTHPVADSQFAADLAGAAGFDKGAGGILDLGTAQTEYNLRVKAADLVMQAGEQPGDALAGGIAMQARKDIGRLAGMLDAIDPDSAKVVRDIIAPGNPIAVDLGADGIQITPPAKVDEIHWSKLGVHVDINFANAEDIKVSKQVQHTLNSWLDSKNVLIIRHGNET